MIFSKNLSYYLNASDKSQKEVADSIGVSTQTFNTWIRGVALPRMGKVQLLADYFHINKSDLIEEKDLTNAFPPLTAAEKNLINGYRMLDEADQIRIQERIDTLASSEKYKRGESVIA